MRRRVLFAVAILASIGTYAGPLALAGRLGSWWWLAGCLLTIPACEIYWRTLDRASRWSP
jgi:hypothetical protein